LTVDGRRSTVDGRGSTVDGRRKILRSRRCGGAAKNSIFQGPAAKNPGKPAATDFASSPRMLIDDGTEGLSEQVIGVGIEVHRTFGPGLLENAYHLPMLWALEKRGFNVEFERPLSVEYEGKVIPRVYIIDLVVEDKVLIEIKSVSAIAPIHIAQVRTYLSLSGIGVGLIMNFNTQVLRHGIKRVLHRDVPRPSESR
jgi:GxxExxY protein